MDVAVWRIWWLQFVIYGGKIEPGPNPVSERASYHLYHFRSTLGTQLLYVNPCQRATPPDYIYTLGSS